MLKLHKLDRLIYAYTIKASLMLLYAMEGDDYIDKEKLLKQISKITRASMGKN